MKPAVAGTFPLFRTGVALDLVTELYTSNEELSLRELAERVGATKQALSNQLPALVRAGLVEHSTRANTSSYRANTGSVFYSALRELIELSEGPPQVLAAELKDVSGISELLIFGSWAARKHGVEGAAPNDIDLLVIGSPDEVDLAEACARAGERLHREVNPKITSVEDWQNDASAFITSIKTGALHRVEHTSVTRSEAPSSDVVSPWEAQLLG